jgi:hypothetical protein
MPSILFPGTIEAAVTDLWMLVILLPLFIITLIIYWKGRKNMQPSNTTTLQTMPHPKFPDNHKMDLVIVGQLTGWKATLAVSEPPTGKTMFYCETCHTLFSPNSRGCPTCLSGIAS